jgi:hypothetical protein
MKQTAESVLREYIQFEDVNQSETIELLPLTIIDAMDEYANQQERSYSKEDLKEAFKFYAERVICDIKYLDDDFTEFIKQFKNK